MGASLTHQKLQEKIVAHFTTNVVSIVSCVNGLYLHDKTGYGGWHSNPVPNIPPHVLKNIAYTLIKCPKIPYIVAASMSY